MSTGSQDDLRNCRLLDLFGRCLKKSKINGNIGHIFHGRLLKHFRMDYSDMSASLGAHFSMMRRSCVSQVTMATQQFVGSPDFCEVFDNQLHGKSINKHPPEN